MTRVRDDRRRNTRRDFALYHPNSDGDDDYGPRRVGAFWLGYADGCHEGFTEDGACFEADFAETHVRGEHDEMQRLLVEPRRMHALQRLTRGIPGRLGGTR